METRSDIARSFMRYLLAFLNKTATLLNSTALCLYHMHVVLLSFSFSCLRLCIEHRHKLLGHFLVSRGKKEVHNVEYDMTGDASWYFFIGTYNNVLDGNCDMRVT